MLMSVQMYQLFFRVSGKLKCLLSVALFFLLSLTALAQNQNYTYTGKVISSDDDKPLAGVTVSVSGTDKAVLTNQAGEFSILLSGEKGTLKFSYVGFESKDIQVKFGNAITVLLSRVSQSLGEVTVTALGGTRKTKSLTYATQTIKAGEINEVRDANIVNTLQGKIAGAVISQGSGGVGGSTRIVLRGNRFISGNNNALFVVDGIPVNNDTRGNIFTDFGGVVGGDGASNINPDDIESVTVLRGASAAALYGSEAANGAILITTKKGRKGAVSVNLNSGVSVESVFGLPDFQNKYGQGVGGVLDANVGESWGAQMTGQSYTNHLGKQSTYVPQPNNVRDFFNKAVSFNNSINITGGNDRAETYFSYSNNKANGIVPGNELTRHTVNFRITNQISSKLSTDFKLTYMNQAVKNIPRAGENNSPVFNAFQMGRSLSKDDAMQFETINNIGIPTPTPYPSTLASIYQNPYWNVNRTSINQDRDRIIGLLSVKYKLLKWLNIQGRANLDKYYDESNSSYHQGTLLFAGIGGSYDQSKATNTRQWYDLMLFGNQELSKNFSLDYQIGAIYSDEKFKSLNGEASGLTIPNRFDLNFGTNPSLGEDFEHDQKQSLFGHLTFSYKSAIYLDLTLRNDWSSTLPAPYSFSYPSAGLSAVISDLIKLPKAISFLKLSGNYAEVGNAPGAYLLSTTYRYQNVVGLTGIGYITRDRVQALGNLKPELSKSIEASLELKLLNNRLGINVTAYKTNAINQLLSIDLPPASGFGSKFINAGNIENKGLEFVINGSPIVSKNFKWDVLFNYGANRNMVISLGESRGAGFGGSLRAGAVIVDEGEPFGNLYAFGLRQSDKGGLLLTNTGLPIRSSTPELVGNNNPNATLGLTNTINYKRFSVRFLVDGRVGGVTISGTEMNLAFSGLTKRTEYNREGNWILPGFNSGGSTVAAPINAEQFWRTVSGGRIGWGQLFTYNQTNFRFRELSLGYDIPTKGNIIKSAKVSFVARNLFWIYRGSNKYDIPGIPKSKLPFDPDMSLSTSNFQGLDYAGVPASRSVGINFKLTF
jgi:TonB-linked SusC/RagA family outer membrane protein